MPRIDLTDEELTLLDGQCRPEVQAEVTQAKKRLESQDRFAHLSPALGGFVADVVSTAEKHGMLIWRHERLRYCPLCEKSAGYVSFKRGPRKGQPNHKKPLSFNGIELKRTFIHIEGRASLGGCSGCIEEVRDALVEALQDVRVQLPDKLMADGAVPLRKYRKAECSACGWKGHEGEMRFLSAIMGGEYRGGCPVCPAENRPFAKSKITKTEGFVLLEEKREK